MREQTQKRAADAARRSAKGVRTGVGGSSGIALALAALVLQGCSGTEDPGGPGNPPPDPPNVDASYEIGDILAQLEIGAPTVTRFVIHGTVPIPPRLYPLDDGVSPFAIRDPDGNEVNAQVEIVSRYAAAADGADVVEVLARVERPESATVGDRLTYSVIWSPNHPVSHYLPDDVKQLVERPGSLVLRTRDVFGHRYEADLLTDLREENPDELQVKREGPVAVQVRTHETLLPILPTPGATGTVPHLMGVHSYLTTWQSENFISLDLRVHNGHAGQNAASEEDDPAGKIYFDSLELVAPAGWTILQAFATPSLGERYLEGGNNVWPLVAPIAGGDLHVMFPQSMFNRRLVLARAGYEASARSLLEEQGLGFCRKGMTEGGFEFFSWWNAQTARYWPQNLALPSLEYLEPMANTRSRLYDDFNAVRTCLLTGEVGPWPIITERLGWAHPWGVEYGGMHGGTEIYFWDGVKTAWSGSQAGYRWFQATHRMYSDRHPTTLYDEHGVAHHQEDWLVHGSSYDFIPTWMWLVPQLNIGDAFGFNDAPTFQVEAVAAQGRQPDYEDYFATFSKVDTQHLIRYTRAPKVLAWLGNDALSKDDLKLQAELSRASYTNYPQTDGGHAISVGAYVMRKFVDDYPGWGFDMDRGHGWIIDAAVAAYAVGDEPWRESVRYWFDEVLDLVEDGQSDCTGAIMAMPLYNHFDGEYRLLQSISECIIQNALWGTRTTVYDGDDAASSARLDAILEASTRVMISPEVWNEEGDVPQFYTALGLFDRTTPPYCGYVPPEGIKGIDGWQTWNVFVFGLLITGDPVFLEMATRMAGGNLTVEGIGMDHWIGEMETRAGIISLIQSLED